MIRIVLVDDEPVVRHGLKMRLELIKEMRVVGEAGDGETALQLVRELKPDVVVMDIELHQSDGITLTRILRAEKSSAAILIHSMHDDAETREKARGAGACAFVSKHEGTVALLKAIREVTKPPQDSKSQEQPNGESENH